MESQFEPIAAYARQAQITCVGRPASRFWNNVVNLHLHNDRLPSPAVLTAAMRSLDHRLAERRHDIGHLGTELQLVPNVMPALLQHEKGMGAQQHHAICLVDQRRELVLLLVR